LRNRCGMALHKCRRIGNNCLGLTQFSLPIALMA
jgi:hypothetical protein